MKQILLLTLPICLLFSCGQASKEEHSHEEAEQHTALELNNGAKWTANPETTSGIQAMITLTDSFSGTEPAGYHTLAVSLLAEYNTIFEKCTMTGEAHAQLHNYLLPLNEQIASLRTCTDNCSDLLGSIKPYLHSYYNYFE
jgi:hypothetical protein